MKNTLLKTTVEVLRGSNSEHKDMLRIRPDGELGARYDRIKITASRPRTRIDFFYKNKLIHTMDAPYIGESDVLDLVVLDGEHIVRT